MGDVCDQQPEDLVTKEEKTYYQELGKRIATLRKQSCVTQVELAKELGCSQQQIASYEAGRVKLPVSALPILTILFSTSLDEIVGVQRKSKRGPTSRVLQQAERVSALPRAKQKFVIEMLDTVLKQNAG